MDFSTRKTIRGLGIVGIVMLMIIGYLLVVQPFMAQSTKYSAELNQVSSDRDTAKNKLTLLQSQKDTIDQVEEHDDELSTKYPGSIDTPSFVSDLNSAARRSGSKITQVSVSIPTIVTNAGGTDAVTPPAGDTATPSATPPAGNASATDSTGVQAAPAPGAESSSSLASVTVDITAEGSVDDLTKFTQELLRIDRNVTVNSVNLSREGEDRKKGTATFSATSYIYKTIPKVSETQENPVDDSSQSDTNPPASPAP